MHIYIHTYIYTYTYIHTYIYTYTGGGLHYTGSSSVLSRLVKHDELQCRSEANKGKEERDEMGRRGKRHRKRERGMERKEMKGI